MNQKEALNLAEVAKRLRAGPGNGWPATLVGRDLGPWTAAERERIDRLRLWMDSWVLPALDAVVHRYGKQGVISDEDAANARPGAWNEPAIEDGD